MSTSYFIYGLLFYLLAAKGVSINYHLSLYIYIYICISVYLIHLFMHITVFKITFKVRESKENFEGSISVVLSKSSQVHHSLCWVRKPGLSGF